MNADGANAPYVRGAICQPWLRFTDGLEAEPPRWLCLRQPAH